MSPGAGPAIRGSRSRSWTRNSRVSVRQVQGSRPMVSRAACWATSSPESTRHSAGGALGNWRHAATIPQCCDTPRVPLVGGLRPHHGEPQNSHDRPLFFPRSASNHQNAAGSGPTVSSPESWNLTIGVKGVQTMGAIKKCIRDNRRARAFRELYGNVVALGYKLPRRNYKKCSS